MTTLRRRLSWIACGWLLCQLAVITVTPVSLCAGAARALEEPGCTCVHTGNAQCPMHHPAKSPSGCNCRSNAPDPGSMTALSLLGPMAVLTNTPARVTPPAITQLPTYPITKFIGLVAPPDGPPPRA